MNLRLRDSASERIHNVTEAWKIVIENINKYQEKGIFPVNLAVELRVTGKSDCLLSPSFSSDPNIQHHCYIEFLSFYKTKTFESISRDISLEWLHHTHLQARPHWAKMFQTVESETLIPFLMTRYGKSWTEWASLRNQADPTKMFLNDYVNNMFYGPHKPISPPPEVKEESPPKVEVVVPKAQEPLPKIPKYAPTIPVGMGENEEDEEEVKLETIGITKDIAKKKKQQHMLAYVNENKAHTSKQKRDPKKKRPNSDNSNRPSVAELEEIVSNDPRRTRSCIIS